MDEVLAKHPEMLLRDEHLAVKMVNWQNKVDNLKQIATILNIGLEHIVFVDDSAFEINLVKEQLPMVALLQISHDAPEEASELLLSSGYFDKLAFSSEDKQRGKFYAAEAKRRTTTAHFATIDEYLESLQMELAIGKVDSNSIARFAQLTQRTNQFNLTTKRYTEDNIKEFVASSQTDVLSVKLKDKFGDLGIIGAAIITYAATSATIDTLLLSCRALSRGVEDALLATIIAKAKKRGCAQVIAEFIPTKKNQQVENFYPTRGFELQATSNSGDHLSYRYNFALTEQNSQNKFHGKIVAN